MFSSTAFTSVFVPAYPVKALFCRLPDGTGSKSAAGFVYWLVRWRAPLSVFRSLQPYRRSFGIPRKESSSARSTPFPERVCLCLRGRENCFLSPEKYDASCCFASDSKAVSHGFTPGASFRHSSKSSPVRNIGNKALFLCYDDGSKRRSYTCKTDHSRSFFLPYSAGSEASNEKRCPSLLHFPHECVLMLFDDFITDHEYVPCLLS